MKAFRFFFLASNHKRTNFFGPNLLKIQKENSGSVITALVLMVLEKLDRVGEELNKTQVAAPPRNTSRNKACCCPDGTQCSENRQKV